ncbi:hypothetical protein ACVW2K_000356 [Nocardioides sp. HB32]
MSGGDRAQHPATARNSTAAKPLTIEAVVAFVTTYSDWGNRCMAALHTPLWASHIQNCPRCAAVQAEWDRQAEAERRGVA